MQQTQQQPEDGLTGKGGCRGRKLITFLLGVCSRDEGEVEAIELSCDEGRA